MNTHSPITHRQNNTDEEIESNYKSLKQVRETSKQNRSVENVNKRTCSGWNDNIQMRSPRGKSWKN